MNLLVVGASHHTADLAVLERLAIAASDLPDELARLVRRPHVAEAVVLSTCNRVEFYAGVTSFHGGLADVSGALAERAGMDPTALAPHLYVRWDADAVRHALRVAAGLDSMVVGETQVLGQLRAAYAAATEADTVGRLLHDLMQQALRVGKRVHAETAIGTAGRSVVTAALELAAARLAGADPAAARLADGNPAAAVRAGGDPAAAVQADGDLAGAAGLRGRPALVIGAGAMGSLAVATLARAGAAPLVVANRDPGRAERLARSYAGRAVPLSQVGELLPTVDVVISATASTGQMLTAATVADALATRPAGRPLVVCDLAVPRDVDPAVAELPGVHLIDTDHLAAAPGVATEAVEAAEEIVAAELEAVCRGMRDARVAPTVAALRARADEIVAAELSRLAQRRPDLTDDQRAAVAHTVHRLVRRLLHQPTVRIRELAAGPRGESYAAALAELFDLQVPQPHRVDEVPELGDTPPGRVGDVVAGPGGGRPGGAPRADVTDAPGAGDGDVPGGAR